MNSHDGTMTIMAAPHRICRSIIRRTAYEVLKPAGARVHQDVAGSRLHDAPRGAADQQVEGNHATFKASLFMAAGAVDHQMGTRDMRQLGG
jgi:formate hydrogenlyase subunit 3/multisubunit Na+/H+ antiporter MnhD subunit